MSKDKTSFLDLIGPLFYRLNLVERGGAKLSLTNLAVMVCIVKIAIAPSISIVDMGALLLSLLNYGHKRYESNKVHKAELDRQDKVDAQHQKHIEAHAEAIKQLTEQVQAQAKVVEEAKSIMTAQKISSAQKRTQL